MSLSQAEDLAGSLPALLRAYECRAASEIALALRNMAADNVAGAESASSGDPFVNQLVSHYAVSRAHGLVRLSQCYRTLPVRCVFLCYEPHSAFQSWCIGQVSVVGSFVAAVDKLHAEQPSLAPVMGPPHDWDRKCYWGPQNELFLGPTKYLIL